MASGKISSVVSGIAIAFIPVSLALFLLVGLLTSQPSGRNQPAADLSANTKKDWDGFLREFDALVEDPSSKIEEAVWDFLDLMTLRDLDDVDETIEWATVGACRQQLCWKELSNLADKRSKPDDIQIGGGYFLDTRYITQFDGNKAYVTGELTKRETTVFHPGEEPDIFPGGSLGQATIGLEFVDDTSWKVTDVELESGN